MKIKGEIVQIKVAEKYKIKGIRCDYCGALIDTPTDIQEQLDEKFKYFSVSTGHHDWGNDSIESIKSFDICPRCIINFINDNLKRESFTRSGYIDIHVEHIVFNEMEED